MNWLSYLSCFTHSWNAESLSFGLLIWCYCAISIFFIEFGIEGLIMYQFIALLIADIQVLCPAKFLFSQDLVPLGTVIYTTIFLVNDLITEHAGSKMAKKSVRLVLFGHLLFFSLILWTLSYPPLTDPNPEHAHFVTTREAIIQLFTPHGVIFFSSQCAYLLSQYIDIHIFAQIKTRIPKAFILRSGLSVLIGIILDNWLFNMLAWRVFSEHIIPWPQLWHDYICFNTMIQLIILFCNIPVFYVLTAYASPNYRVSRLFFFLFENRPQSSPNRPLNDSTWSH